MKNKFIFITGGVCSSLGKGITAGSLGCLLESRGLTVSLQKMDPYINIDAGTMSPYQHGEVYVTDDGSETDLDLGIYSRFTSSRLSKLNSITAGQIYQAVINRERRGEYLGRTVQVIPHITNEIKSRIYNVVKEENPDVVICEIGGTVGDIEGIPFIEAIRQFPQDVGKDNVIYIHLTLIPYIDVAGESKTKPTQHSVKELREMGIKPDILVCRTSRTISKEMKKKLALFCDVEPKAIIQGLDTDASIYEIPIEYHKEDFDAIVVEKLNIKSAKNDLSEWNNTLEKLRKPKGTVKIAVVGKYTDLPDAYKSVYEAITHGGIANNLNIEIKKVDSSKVTEENAKEFFSDIDGILVPGGFGERAVTGMIKAITYSRENNIPTFGICLGLQCMVVEFANNVCGLKNANTTECDENTSFPVVSLLEEQKDIDVLGGTMRLGASQTIIKKDSLAYSIYQSEEISERHRHRYEFNNDFLETFEKNGMKATGFAKEQKLVEIVEVPKKRWFFGVQYHPEFQSKPTDVHPVFASFIDASYKYQIEKNQDNN